MASHRPSGRMSWIVEPSGALDRGPPPARERDGVDREVVVGPAGGEEHFLAARRPGKPLLSPVPLGEHGPLAREVHDGDEAAVVVLQRVLEERDAVPLRRESQVAHVPARFAEDLPDGKLQPVLPADVSDDGQVRAVGRPVGFADTLQDLSRGRPLDRHPRERAVEEIVRDVAGARQDGKLAPRRDRKQMDVGESAGVGPRKVGTQREDLGNAPLDRRAEDDLSVRREARLEDRLLPERQLREGGPGRRPAPLYSTSGDVGRRDGRREDRHRHSDENAAPRRGGFRGDGPNPGRREPGQ